MAQYEDQCPHCGEGRLRSWQELGGEEQEVVRRLPGAAAYAFDERVRKHRWCNVCWHEAPENTPRTV